MKVCVVDSCSSPSKSKGYCGMHYARVRRYGDPHKTVRVYSTWDKCSFSLCERVKELNIETGLCKTHLAQHRKGNTLTPIIPRYSGVLCETPECKETAVTKNKCRIHYLRWKFNRPMNPKPRVGPGARRLDNNGYVIFTWPEYPFSDSSGTVREHRFVMEEHLGRRLTTEESVHHKNGDRQDNRLENLELWSKYQPAGQRVEDKVAFAKEILSLYQPEALTPQD